MNGCFLRGLKDFFVAGIRPGKCDVVSNGLSKQEWFLWNNADVFPDPFLSMDFSSIPSILMDPAW